MRIIVHFDKRTASAPCRYDVELNLSAKDTSLEAEYGRAVADDIARKIAAVEGFEPARKRLRGCPSVVLRYRRGAGEFSAPDATGMDWAPHVRVAFANFVQVLSKACAKAGADGGKEEPVASCRSCRHFEQRPNDVRSSTFLGRTIINARLRPYCRLRGAFLTYADYDGGCERKEAAE